MREFGAKRWRYGGIWGSHMAVRQTLGQTYDGTAEFWAKMTNCGIWGKQMTIWQNLGHTYDDRVEFVANI